MTDEHLTGPERVGMIVINALVLVALPLTGLLSIFGGSMSGMVEYVEDGEAGYALAQSGVPDAAEITATPIVGINTRAWLLLVAIVVLGLLAVYRLSVLANGSSPTRVSGGSEAPSRD
ncbi:MAG: hypothetical protein ACOCZC_01165 [Halodesulfurarchaeum sp.]